MELNPPMSHRAIGIHGRLSVTVVDTAWFKDHRNDDQLMMSPPAEVIRDYRVGDNIVCTSGLTVMAAAMVWAGIQDQAVNQGVTTPTYLTPLWGAVGSGTGTVAASDVALFTELGRQIVGAGASAPATPTLNSQITWLFYFPQPSVTWTVTEAGIFANADSGAGDGTLMDHWLFSPSISVPTSDTLILQASFTIAGM